MNEITLSLNIEEINELLTALGHQPFIKVHELIDKIQRQAAEQVQRPQNGRISEAEKAKEEI